MERIWIAAPFIAFGAGIHYYKSPWIALTLYHLLIISALFIHRRQIDLRRLWQGFSWKWLLAHLFGCAILGWALVELATLKQFKPGNGQGLHAAGIGFVVYFLIINPVLEEVFWRDLLAKNQKSLTIEDAFFGLFHAVILYPLLNATYTALFVLGLVAIAYVWRRIRFQENGLAIPWIGHFLGDAMFVAIIAILNFR